VKLTAKRLAWLKRLLLGPAHRTSNVGYYCMQAGWSEWNWLDRHGQPISMDEAKERWGSPDLWSHITSDGERITQLGREVLMAEEQTIDGQRWLKVDLALDDVRQELRRVLPRWPLFHSHHEGYAVLLEEVDEAWDEIKANNHAKAREEMIQVAAMAIRFIAELEG